MTEDWAGVPPHIYPAIFCPEPGYPTLIKMVCIAIMMNNGRIWWVNIERVIFWDFDLLDNAW